MKGEITESSEKTDQVFIQQYGGEKRYKRKGEGKVSEKILKTVV